MKTTTILFTTDYTPYNQYEAACQKNGWPSYINAIKREQRFLANLLRTKYQNTKPDPRLRILAYIHADFGKRTEADYKVAIKDSKDYQRFMRTDDYSDTCALHEAIHFFKQ